MSGGSPVGNALANSQQQTPMGGGTSPLNTGGGMSGGQTQMPNFATPNMQRYETNEPFSLAHGPFSSVNSTTQQDIMGRRGGGSGMPFGQRLGQLGFGDQQMAVPGAFNPSEFMNYGRQPQQQFAPFGSGRGDPIDPSMKIDRRLARGQMLGYDPGPQQPELSDVVGHFGDMQYRPQRYDPIAAEQNYYARMAQQYQQPQPMRNPFQPDPSMVAEEYPAQSYGDMRYRPQPYNPYQQQMQQMRQFQQPSPFRGGQFQQRFAPYQSGLQSLMGQLRGRPMQQPRMAMDMPQTNRPMETLPASFPQTFGREQRYANPSADYRSVNRAAPAPAPALAPAPAPAPASAYDYF